ncbi:MAG TPA: LysE family translocator [Saprospiraceae bacterium]|nr:LysE family translocator [Saprospiraceae bacterium]HMP12667.1 LysE family translocator [Saprospiraceae bacterium]
MKSLIEGIQTGLILCFLIGPIFFTLIQTGVERGFRAGAMVGLGIWVSDALFILAYYSGVSYIVDLLTWKDFSLYVGIAGSIILAIFGLWALLTRPDFAQPADVALRPSASYFSLWLKGFLINSINPFTVIFWFTMMSTALLQKELDRYHVSLFFIGTIGTIAFTDMLKVLLAKRIRRWLRPDHILLMRRISGIALILFGVVLFARTLYVMW